MTIKINSVETSNAITLVQFSNGFENTFNYISSKRAIEKNFVTVKEVDQTGSVNDLMIINDSDYYVFFMDGDILLGAKQNRVLNSSVLIKPHSKTIIPVSCVEQGRWSKISDKFDKSEYTAPSFIRAKKSRSVNFSLINDMGYYADQSEVWDNVSYFLKRNKVNSPTESIDDIYTDRFVLIDKQIKQFKAVDNSNCLAVFVNGRFNHLDAFNRTDIYNEYFPQIIKSLVLEYYEEEITKNVNKDEIINETIKIYDSAKQLQGITKDSIGVGKERRFENDEITGFELTYENHLIHLSIFDSKIEE